jgi:hypothetical protein
VNFHGVLQSCSTCSRPHSPAGRLGVGSDRPLLRPGLSGSATTTTINHVACAAGDVMGLMELQCSVLPPAYYCTPVRSLIKLISLVAVIHAFGRFIFATKMVQIKAGRNPPYFRFGISRRETKWNRVSGNSYRAVVEVKRSSRLKRC